MTSQDLSHAFGRPATASLRGLLPPRNGTNRWPEPPEPRRPPDDEVADSARDDTDLDEDDDLDEGGDDEFDDDEFDDADLEDDEREDDEPDDDRREDHGPHEVQRGREERPPRTARRAGAAARRPSTSGTERPRGRVRVASREHADLLVLLSLRQGPADGRGVIARLRETTGGHLDVGEQTVYLTLHRLTRNRLLGRLLDPASGRRFYALREAGERAARARLREWHALTRCVDAVARAGE